MTIEKAVEAGLIPAEDCDEGDTHVLPTHDAGQPKRIVVKSGHGKHQARA